MQIKINRIFLIKRILPVAAGGLLGYAYYHFIGCYNGSCAITSNPYISTLYGALMGLVFAFPSGKKKSEEAK